MPELVHLEVAEQVATITLDSERNRNALSKQLVTELAVHLATADAEPVAKAVLIRSAGTVFCSGADMTEAVSGGMAEGAKAIVALQRQIATATKPVVVELGGPVRAGGLGIVGAADIVIAAESVTFQLTEVRLGLAAAIISLTVHARMTPRSAALTTLGGAVFTGEQAAAYGLVTRAEPAIGLTPTVVEICLELATGSPQGLRESKAILNRDLVARIDAHGEEMATLSARLFASDEARAAMTAFLNRKK